MNGAGEVAVHAFLRGEIPFLSIAEVMEAAIAKTQRTPATSLSALVETDRAARAYATEAIAKKI
jgi:1-deoxy-D-xylulose-5-phosphate reductoisomerase